MVQMHLATLYYCKSRNFREDFIFQNIVRRHTCDIENSRLGHDLHLSVNDRVILPFLVDLIFTKIRICHENKTLTKISKFTVSF